MIFISVHCTVQQAFLNKVVFYIYTLLKAVIDHVSLQLIDHFTTVQLDFDQKVIWWTSAVTDYHIYIRIRSVIGRSVGMGGVVTTRSAPFRVLRVFVRIDLIRITGSH